MNKKINDLHVDSIWNANNELISLNLGEYLKLCRMENERIQYLYVYKPGKAYIDLDEVNLFINFLHAIPTDSIGRNILPIYIDLQNARFCDKLVYVMMETVICYLIESKNWLISVQGTFESENCSNGIRCSSLTQGNWSISLMNQKNFADIIAKKNSIRIQHYKYNRKEMHDICSTRFFVTQSNNVNNIASDIFSFLSTSSVLNKVDDCSIKRIANTIMEMISNCSEHTKSSYIYDIDLKKVVHHANIDLHGREYIAVNVALWDFSNIRLGDAIKRKIKIMSSLSSTDDEYIEQIGLKENIFKKLLYAYEIHASFWDEFYTEDEFFALAAFQPGITGRPRPGSTGGAGLTHVLDFLCDYPDNYRCYCLTGDTIINLNKSFLSKDDDNWFAFGDEGLFTTNKPSKYCISKSKFFYPGTAFFLHLELN